MKLIDKDHINELRKLYNDIDSCISDLIVARSKSDDDGIAAAHWQMETLIVDTQQAISRIVNTLEVKEVDLENEIDKELDEEWYGEYINLEKFKRTAKHFFELGLKAEKKE